MIPPIAPSILAANPQFALLHKHLSTHLLNPDASMKSTSTPYEPTAKKLKQHHIRAARHDIVKRTLYNIVADETLPPELIELLIAIATYLSEAPKMNLGHEAHDLMASEVEAFQSDLSVLAPLLSSHIQHARDALLPLTSASASTSTSTSASASASTTTITTKPTSPATPTPLSTNLTTRHTQLTTLHHITLPNNTTTLTNTLLTLLSTHTTHLVTQIQQLELHTHGTLSRHTIARATHLSTIASGLEAKTHLLALQAQQALYTPAVQRALAAYLTHLRAFRASLSEREEQLTRELDLYEDDGVGGAGLKECAKRYGLVAKEIDVVKGEIARLEGEMRMGMGTGTKVGRTWRA